MKLKEYIKYLNDIYEEHGNIEICYSVDDEGNGYCRGVFQPEVRLTSETGYSFDECIPLSELKKEEYDNSFYMPIDEYTKICLIN